MVAAVAVDAGNNWLAAGCGDGSVCVFHVGARLLTSRGAVSGAVHSLHFHDGQVP